MKRYHQYVFNRDKEEFAKIVIENNIDVSVLRKSIISGFKNGKIEKYVFREAVEAASSTNVPLKSIRELMNQIDAIDLDFKRLKLNTNFEGLKKEIIKKIKPDVADFLDVEENIGQRKDKILKKLYSLSTPEKAVYPTLEKAYNIYVRNIEITDDSGNIIMPPGDFFIKDLIEFIKANPDNANIKEMKRFAQDVGKIGAGYWPKPKERKPTAGEFLKQAKSIEEQDKQLNKIFKKLSDPSTPKSVVYSTLENAYDNMQSFSEFDFSNLDFLKSLIYFIGKSPDNENVEEMEKFVRTNGWTFRHNLSFIKIFKKLSSTSTPKTMVYSSLQNEYSKLLKDFEDSGDVFSLSDLKNEFIEELENFVYNNHHSNENVNEMSRFLRDIKSPQKPQAPKPQQPQAGTAPQAPKPQQPQAGTAPQAPKPQQPQAGTAPQAGAKTTNPLNGAPPPQSAPKTAPQAGTAPQSTQASKPINTDDDLSFEHFI
jgi:hypothetical protein